MWEQSGNFLKHRLANFGLLAAKKQAKKGLVPSTKLKYLTSVVYIANLLDSSKL